MLTLIAGGFETIFLSCSSFLYFTWVNAAWPHTHSEITFITKWRGQLNIRSLARKCNCLLERALKMYQWIHDVRATEIWHLDLCLFIIYVAGMCNGLKFHSLKNKAINCFEYIVIAWSPEIHHWRSFALFQVDILACFDNVVSLLKI